FRGPQRVRNAASCMLAGVPAPRRFPPQAPGTRMNLQGFLDHLLKSQSPSSPVAPGTGGSPGGGLLNADFGKGAITGGALGLLLGKNKTTRKLATYGGLAAIGVMAYKAYSDYK